MLLGPLRYQMLAISIKFSNDIQQMTCVVIGKCHLVMQVIRQQWVIIRWNTISNINNYHPFEQSSAWRLESNAVKTCFFSPHVMCQESRCLIYGIPYVNWSWLIVTLVHVYLGNVLSLFFAKGTKMLQWWYKQVLLLLYEGASPSLSRQGKLKTI